MVLAKALPNYLPVLALMSLFLAERLRAAKSLPMRSRLPVAALKPLPVILEKWIKSRTALSRLKTNSASLIF